VKKGKNAERGQKGAMQQKKKRWSQCNPPSRGGWNEQEKKKQAYHIAERTASDSEKEKRSDLTDAV